ncbi:MAG: sensor histidine kinase [Candidatus Ranarchaeia archaeon]
MTQDLTKNTSILRSKWVRERILGSAIFTIVFAILPLILNQFNIFPLWNNIFFFFSLISCILLFTINSIVLIQNKLIESKRIFILRWTTLTIATINLTIVMISLVSISGLLPYTEFSSILLTVIADSILGIGLAWGASTYLDRSVIRIKPWHTEIISIIFSVIISISVIFSSLFINQFSILIITLFEITSTIGFIIAIMYIFNIYQQEKRKNYFMIIPAIMIIFLSQIFIIYSYIFATNTSFLILSFIRIFGLLLLFFSISEESVEILIQKTNKMIKDHNIEGSISKQESKELSKKYVHDIKNNMQIIQTTLDQLRDPKINDKNREKYAKIANSSLMKMNDLVNSSQEIQKLTNNNGHKQKLDIIDIIKKTSSEFSSIADIKFNLEMKNLIIPTSIIMNQVFKMVLENLIIQNNRTEKKIYIDVKVQEKVNEQKVAIIEISDNGPGVPDNQKKSIFKRIIREGEEPRYSLSLIKTLIENNNGEIFISDRIMGKPGLGIKISILLPF